MIFEATPQAKIRARELRKNATYTEILFWNQAKGGQILGCDFHRQKPIGRFIVDFFAPDLLLAIEIDGPIHNDNREQDAERQASLKPTLPQQHLHTTSPLRSFSVPLHKEISTTFFSEEKNCFFSRMTLNSEPMHSIASRPSRPVLATLLLGLCALCSATLQPNLGAQTTTPEWRNVSPLPNGLFGHRTLLLPTGDLLITGGIGADGRVSRTSLLYSSQTGSTRPTLNQMNNARSHHLIVSVNVGGIQKVYAIGGFGGGPGSYDAEGSIEVLLFDATQGNWRWRPAGRLPVARGDLRGAWDGGDYIIVTGGYETVAGGLRSGPRSSVAARVNVVTDLVETLPAMDDGRAEHTVATILDENGNVVTLVAGGESNSGGTATQILEGVLWNSLANPPLAYRTGGVGFGDRVLIGRAFGGFDAAGTPTDACEWYDVKRGWRNGPRMSDPRARFDMTLIAGLTDSTNAYLGVAGSGTGGDLRSTEIFELPTGSLPNGAWTPFLPLIDPASEREVAINGANLPVVIGGTRGGTAIAGIEVLQPLRADDTRFPDEEVGRRSDSIQLSIRNEWLLPVRLRTFRIAGSAAFFFRGDTSDFVIPAGGSRTIRLYFQPGSAGPHAGELLFDVGELTNRVKLSGNAVASTLAVINAPYDGGEVFLKSRQTYCFHILRNDGTDTAVIDSVTVDPPGDFRVVSPKGRSSIPPGDSLEVCIEFEPSVRGDASTAVRVHLAGRTFPGETIARGVRRYVTATTVSAECDTVVYAPETEVSGFIRLENPGDSPVRVTDGTITQGALGLFRLADPTIFPLDLQPGEFRLVEVIFSPIRESRESATITFENDGDTTAAVDLCFVARSRFLSPSQATLSFGDICVGDSLELTLVLENPGGFDQVELLSATIDPAADLRLDGFTPVLLGPREFTRVRVRYAPTAAGTLNATLRVTNSQGELRVPIEGRALEAARFEPQDLDIAVGETLPLPIDLVGLSGGAPLGETTLTFEYDPTILLPIGLVSLPGGPTVDPAGSSVTVEGSGRARVVVAWQGPGPTGSGPAFALEIEALRGESERSLVGLEGVGSNDVCIARGSGEILLLPACWGPAGGIRTAKARGLYANPQPASSRISLLLLNQPEGVVAITLLDTDGRAVLSTTSNESTAGSRHLDLDLEALPAGFYLIRAVGSDGMMTSTPILLQ